LLTNSYALTFCTVALDTGETPYSCDICGLQFRWQSSQKAHLKAHERRRQRENPDAENAQGDPYTSALRGSKTILPAIGMPPLHSTPHVEPLEPPIPNQHPPRREMNIAPLDVSRQGASFTSEAYATMPPLPPQRRLSPVPSSTPSQHHMSYAKPHSATISRILPLPPPPHHLPPPPRSHTRAHEQFGRTFPSTQDRHHHGTTNTSPPPGSRPDGHISGGSGSSGSSGGSKNGGRSRARHAHHSASAPEHRR
jgi:hypothetical protein